MLLKRIAALSAVVFAFAAIATPSSQSYAQEKKEVKEVKEKKVELRDDWPDVEGKLAKVVKVDVKKRVVHVEWHDGKSEELTLGKEVEFLGPKGGKAKDIKDDRLVEGKTIKVVHDKEGKVKQIHLSIRKKTD
jgi:hypothetical protein